MECAPKSFMIMLHFHSSRIKLYGRCDVESKYLISIPMGHEYVSHLITTHFIGLVSVACIVHWKISNIVSAYLFAFFWICVSSDDVYFWILLIWILSVFGIFVPILQEFFHFYMEGSCCHIYL